MTPTASLLACAASLLDQGRTVDRLSRSVTAAALIGMPAYAAALGPPPFGVTAVALLVALAGFAESYFAVRVGFDAALFHRVANIPGVPDFSDTDEALTQLGLLPPLKRGRPVLARIAGARRLMRLQIVALVLQIALIAISSFAITWR